MKMNKISKKLISPETPTPPNLKNYHISFLDSCTQGLPNVTIILYYKSKPDNYSQLEESLAKTLVQFYPLAGRYIKNDLMVDCSDQGAEFVTAEALDLELIDVIEKIDIDQLESLVPEQYFRNYKNDDDPILSIQVTRFQCGGAAIATTIPHIIFDAASLGTFITAWSDATNPGKIVGFTPNFDLPSLLPKKDHNFGMRSSESSTDGRVTCFKRLVFNEATLTSLKSKTWANKKTISGARLVTAVIAEALIRLDRTKLGRTRDFVLIQPVNIRERTVPSQPKHSCGNFVFPSAARHVAGDIELEGLVHLIGDGIRKVIADLGGIVCPENDGHGIIINTLEKVKEEVCKPDTHVVRFNDWSKFGFYGADFGWGKPVWTSPGPLPPSIGFNTTLLMGKEEGNWIEAWVCLNPDDIRCFEEDEAFKLCQ